MANAADGRRGRWKIRRTETAHPGTLSAGGDADDPDLGSDSDLPDALSLLKTPAKKPGGSSSSSSSSRRKRPRRSLVKSASDVSPLARADDSDTGGDTALKVPGELILAYALRKYYPARVLSQPGPNRFLVQFFDGSRSTLSRGRILTMYEAKFYSCPLGGLRLVGDEPVQAAGMAPGAAVDPEKDFERDRATFRRLEGEVESIRGCLDALHGCPPDQLDAMREIEDRVAVFFGPDASAKRRLPARVAKGFLNRAEFDFLGRLLCRWYAAPPRPLLQAAASGSAGRAGAEANEDAGDSAGAGSPDSVATEVVGAAAESDPKLAAQAVEFVHEVLLPHAIRRLTMAREKCTLAESELSMLRSDSDMGWVDQILAARRGVLHDSARSREEA
ncbi:hypothetical protein H4R18_001708 [Coemansia javaensis]|uniref:Uncharacterized protein n=1 Tax=Coemansia javaensis TaxID=2761396 RepID=A0A9W8HIW6_9FUNG|nr:hypothetical protein H4R18_001708 [Coemansia javaensis]